MQKKQKLKNENEYTGIGSEQEIKTIECYTEMGIQYQAMHELPN
mgnify:CR=1 FL=1